MSLLVRLLVLFAVAAFASVPVAVAAKPDTPADKAKEPGKPAEVETPAAVGAGEVDDPKPAKEERADKETGRPDDKPEKDHVAPGQAKKDGLDAPLHPLGGAPGLLREPNESAHPEHTVLTETVGATPNTGVVLVKVVVLQTCPEGRSTELGLVIVYRRQAFGHLVGAGGGVFVIAGAGVAGSLGCIAHCIVLSGHLPASRLLL